MKHLKVLLILFAFLVASKAWSFDTGMIEMVRVQGGCYKMGTHGYERHEQPVHNVCLNSFEIGKFEVTQKQWHAVMGANPSRFTTCGDECPVDRVTWNQAQQFIQLLNAQNKGKFRLPTEAEWEYACRSGGKDEIWAGTNSATDAFDFAWVDKATADNQTHKVGTKKPNGLGIHDMTGNVYEWVQDKFVSPYPTTPENNPLIESGGEDKRVIRGGSWHQKVHFARCGNRYRYVPDFKDTGGRIGVRVVREIAQ